MARRKKPQITGTDPSYDHSFERFRPIPNDMPPDVVVPGVEATTTPVDAKTMTHTETEPKPRAKPTTAKPKKVKQQTVSMPATEQPQAAKREEKVNERQTTLDAAVKVSQAKAMARFEKKGLKMRDIVTLAGRRATERFVLSPIFVPKLEADRMPMKLGYHTSKRLPGDILDEMRKKEDPLGISSDPAMVRGQFEPLFWLCLDEVIDELSSKY